MLLAAEEEGMLIYGADLQTQTAHDCEWMVYLYTLRVWGAVKAGAGNSIIPCVAHMSADPLLFHPEMCWNRSHFHVRQQSTDVASAIYKILF